MENQSPDPFPYYVNLAKLGIGVKGAVLLSYFIYISKRYENEDGWFCRNAEEIQLDLGGISISTLSTMRGKLRESGFLIEQRRGMPARIFYKLDHKKISDSIESLDLGGSTDA